MPRANRYYQSGLVWHITHRCHKKEFLLKFSRDRSRWLYWLYQAKKRYGLSVLNYVVTSNHIHLLVSDTGDDCISKSLQLIAGRTAQEYNRRKKRKGAFWEDRYHATAVEAGHHLIKCLVYIDLNMVRAGAVTHPQLWAHGGYRELQTEPKRYRIINRQALFKLTGFKRESDFQSQHRIWIDQAINENLNHREAHWSNSVAIGSPEYIERLKAILDQRAQAKKIEDAAGEGEGVLEEVPSAYKRHLDAKIRPLRGYIYTF